MKIKLMTVMGAVALGAVWATIGGCDAGNAPPGMNGDDAKAAIAKLSPAARIRAIQGSPMPQAEKDKQIAEIERTSGVKAEPSKSPVIPGGG